MSALFKWQAALPIPQPAVGARRVIRRFLWLPLKLDGEWRWLGSEWIGQEFRRYRVQPPEMEAMDVVGWRDVCWDRSDERALEVRRLATSLWVADGGHVSSNSTAIHSFMVQCPLTRNAFEQRAAEQIEAKTLNGMGP